MRENKRISIAYNGSQGLGLDEVELTLVNDAHSMKGL
jgi:hypothetical protein